MKLSISETKNRGGRPRVDATPVMVRMPPAELADVDGWIARQSAPVSRPEALRILAKGGLAADRQARAKAKTDAAGARAQDAADATADYAAAQRAETQKTDRLRQVRLAKEEHDRSRTAAAPPAAMTVKTRKKLAAEKPLAEARAERRAAGAARAKELAVGAVREELTQVDATAEEKVARTKKLVKRPHGMEPLAPVDRRRT